MPVGAPQQDTLSGAGPPGAGYRTGAAQPRAAQEVALGEPVSIPPTALQRGLEGVSRDSQVPCSTSRRFTLNPLPGCSYGVRPNGSMLPPHAQREKMVHNVRRCAVVRSPLRRRLGCLTRVSWETKTSRIFLWQNLGDVRCDFQIKI